VKRFIEGTNRSQAMLLPECVEDYVGPDNPVRVVEAFVEQLDLRAMGFAGSDPQATGRLERPPESADMISHLS
jgi:transposase